MTHKIKRDYILNITHYRPTSEIFGLPDGLEVRKEDMSDSWTILYSMNWQTGAHEYATFLVR